MRFAFDLWSYADVDEYADVILGRLEAGTMPCDGAWPPQQVELFRHWISSGKPAWDSLGTKGVRRVSRTDNPSLP
jgi:hypothetical protein